MSSSASDKSSSSSSSDSGSRDPPLSSKRRSTRQALKRSYEHPLYTEIDEEDDDEVPKILTKLKGRKRVGGGGKEDAGEKQLRDYHPPKPIPRPPETLPTVPAYFTSKHPHLESEELREMANFEYQKSELNRTFDILWNLEATDYTMNEHILLKQAKADLVAQGGLPSVTMGDNQYIVIRFIQDTPTFEIHHLPPEVLQGQTAEETIGLVDGEILKRSMDIYMTLLNRQ